MAATIPTRPPRAFRSGDTLKFTLSFADYPADGGWTATFNLRSGDGTPINFSSTASGSLHLFSVSPATTATWLPTDYSAVCRVTDGTDEHTVWHGRIQVLPNLAVEEAVDTRSHARKTLDAIEAVIENRATSDVLNHSIEGVSISKLSIADLMLFRDRYKQIVNLEEQAERVSQGLGTGRKIYSRFTRPS